MAAYMPRRPARPNASATIAAPGVVGAGLWPEQGVDERIDHDANAISASK
jgi:hypothetical protein